MTSFIINAHEGRPVHSSWRQDESCAFCKIVSGELKAFRLYEDDKVIAILDIMPLRKGHTLVIPKTHFARLSELPPEFAAAVGEVVTKVAHAITQAVENTALNVVCNQEYAQAVHHVHYHIIPAPSLNSPPAVKDDHETKTLKDPRIPLTHREMHRREFESRDELDDDDALVLVQKVKAHL
ncbi:HIT-like protein [Athelia psychrophila]|uniref:HIT-like protein n=1 Tax=Athelia psychrophila TaxID=1759441 RepID=A0A166A6X6_9AGAM|nr:HIT-like protein [Fibularhizoctonia sp. CBS 109695]